MKNFKKVFKEKKSIIGMIHVDALPGTPKSKNNIKIIIEKAKKEAKIYKRAGVDAVMLENMHDIPYLNKEVGPEIVSAMTAACVEVKKILSDIPCGVQILAAANKEALAVAKAAELDFIRVEAFVFAHVADEGIIESCAGKLLRYRKQIDAENILILADIKKKHSAHSITSDVDIIETAHAVELFMGDGIIITGTFTGHEANIEEIESVKKAAKIPVLVGSGITYENVQSYLKIADALIIGSYFKKKGYWENEVDYARVRKFMDKIKKIRKKQK
ncbi:BtpA/SgcQ family protein [Candidatus Parcubacteria bacterium]|nr:BtpA/SgcQ family protein [Candidatus Parcubacteria bacterium]